MITSHEHSRVSSYRERPPVGYEEGLGRTPQKNFGVPRGVKKPKWVGSEYAGFARGISTLHILYTIPGKL